MFLLYIDPGTGMIILQFIISLFAGVALFFKTIRRKIKDFFKKNDSS
ncbi:MAG: hypothetical protein P8M03_06325 [Flavobacteriaceae bacterium]|nr:hypothetical protein [Flavobacteriaceae bacterium]